MSTSNTATEPSSTNQSPAQRHPPGSTDPTQDTEDYVRLAAFATPADAHVLRGLLASAGLSPVVVDANTGQGNPWVSQSVHAIGVLLPASEVAAGRDVQAAFESGAYALEDGDTPPPSPINVQPALIFNPDRAALLSLLLSPMFGAVVLMANARALGWRSDRFYRWFWLLVATAATGFSVALLHAISPGWLVGFRANLSVLGGLTVLWYFFIAQAQSRQIISAYGPHYRRRSLLVPAVVTALGWLVLGVMLTHLGD